MVCGPAVCDERSILAYVNVKICQGEYDLQVKHAETCYKTLLLSILRRTTFMANQVAYTSLLQMFLTRRALVMVVCDAGAFELRDSSLSDDVQLDQDVRRIDALRVCDWLRFLSFRIPDSGVILVATKCDLAAGMAPDIAARFETASNLWLKTWAEGGMKAVRIEAGASLTSCCFTEGLGREEGTSRFVRGLRYLRHLWKFGWVLEDLESKPWSCDWCENKNDEPPPSLLHRIIFKPDGNELRGAEMALPRSWDIALRVLDALRGGRQVLRNRNYHLVCRQLVVDSVILFLLELKYF